MNRLIAALLITFNALPAFASDGTYKMIMFAGKASRGTDIVYTKPDNVSTADKAFIFTPTNNDEDPKHYTWNASGLVYDYTPPAPVLPPKPTHFIKLCATDGTVPDAAIPLVTTLAVLTDQEIKDVWAARKGVFTAAQQTKIKNYAAAANITLE